MMKSKKYKEQLLAMQNFNLKNPVGSKVNLLLDSGEVKEVTVSNPATMLGGHTAVGWFSEVSGCYNLTNVTSLNTKPSLERDTAKAKQLLFHVFDGHGVEKLLTKELLDTIQSMVEGSTYNEVLAFRQWCINKKLLKTQHYYSTYFYNILVT